MLHRRPGRLQSNVFVVQLLPLGSMLPIGSWYSTLLSALLLMFAAGLTDCMIPFLVLLMHCSMGSFGDSSFEEGIFNLYGTKTHTFDPFLLPEKQELMRKLPYVYFHDFGLGAKTEKVTDEGTRITGLVKDIHTIMEELGHTFVDIFKVQLRACSFALIVQCGNLR